MNIIKGLITKDLLQLRNYRKTLIVFIFIFIVTSLTEENSQEIDSLLSIMLALGFGMFSIATFNYDEMAKADRYILTFPLSRKEVVFSKYIFVILSTTFGAILGVLASLVIGYGMHGKMPDINTLISAGLGAILGIGLIESIQIPCIYKWGAEKGRIQLFIVIAMVVFLVGGIFYIGEKVNIQFSLQSSLSYIENFLPLICLMATVIIYFISYKVACRIYCKKEI